MTELFCVEHPMMPAVAAIVHSDQRRLSILLQKERRYAPTPSYLEHVQSPLIIDESKRKELLIRVYDALCQDAQRSDVYQLAVNLFDRYLSYQALASDKELQALTAACTMVSLKIRRARRECLSYYQLLYHFRGVSEKSIMVKEKEIFSLLKGNLNAVTPADFTDELCRRMVDILPPHLTLKLLDEAHFLANFCLLSYQFISVPPSLLASACLCDIISHMATDRIAVVKRLAELTRVEQDVLLQQQHNVNTAFLTQVKPYQENSTTPTGIEDIAEQEFGHFQFPPQEHNAHATCVATTK